jgi:hypothetical protein
MPLTIFLSDELLSGDSGEVARKILEHVALEGFKSGNLTTSQVRQLLGFQSKLQVHGFLAAHEVPWVDYDTEELQNEVDTLSKLVP